MTKTPFTLVTALFFGLMLSAGATFAGGDGCPMGGKDKGQGKGDTALVDAPAQPLA